MQPFTLEEQLNHASNSLYLIEASAGTGKTYTIANLYLRHILAGKSVSQILVVTFTKAATEELKGRIRLKLHETLQTIEAEQTPEDEFVRDLLDKHERNQAKVRLELAVRSMDEASIFTIHGFCQRALQEFAFLSGQSFNLDFNTDEDEILLPIAKDWWRRNIYEADDLTYDIAIKAWSDVQGFYRQIKGFLSHDVKLIPEVVEDTTDLSALASEIRQSYHAAKHNIWDMLESSPKLSRTAKNYYKPEALDAVCTTISEWVISHDSNVPPDEFEALTTTCIEANSKKTGKAPIPSDAFFDLCDNYWQQYQNQRQHQLTQLITDAVTYFKEKGEDSKTDKQTLSFNDLLIQFDRALHSSQGEPLRNAIQARYPLAMIDEFQDTDPVQYCIFKQLYIGQSKQTLYMIGDPKQAIYSFRGGDIYTYLQAKQDVEQYGGTQYTLDTNWRSTPSMIDAVNTVFGTSDNPFLYDGIPFQPVQSPENKTDHKTLTIHGETITPMNFWMTSDVSYTKANKVSPLSKEKANAEIDHAVAQQIATLINLGKHSKALLGDKPLRPKDIAVLVPSHNDSNRLRAVLNEYQVASITTGKESVYQSDEADALSVLLHAVLHPDDRNSLKQALSSHLMAYNYVEIYEISHDDQAWHEWCDHFRSLNEQWRQSGFMSMFLSLLERLKIAEALAKQDDTDRIMTNLLQLGELLQQASKEQTGMEALIAWFEQKRANSSQNEEAELRLESDDELVKLVTLHSSKGLEYGVVFLPYLWNLRAVDIKDRPILFHDEANQLIAYAGSENNVEYHRLAEYERLAENMRLVYVALTRAVSCCYIAWGNIGQQKSGSNKSALGYLLHGKQNPESLKTEDIASSQHHTIAMMADDVAAIAAQSQQNIAITHITDLQFEAVQTEAANQDDYDTELSVKTMDRSLTNYWRITSFSALSRNIHHNSPVQKQHPSDPILNFPAGKQTGLYLHSLFEYLDFTGDIAEQVVHLNQRLLSRYNLQQKQYNDTTQQWADKIVNTKLNDTGLTLANISKSQRLNELAFHFSTGNEQVSIRLINEALEQWNTTDQPLQKLQSQKFTGLINGIIDLVFEHNGQYYLADYKTNYLGNHLDHYNVEHMQAEIYQRRYDLQYMLYATALHRFLQTRLDDYDYETHFGGIYYLFFRGMRPDHDTGVFFTKPDFAFIKHIDSCFNDQTHD